MPAPPKNRNRTLHGVKGWLAIASLPKGASYIRRMQGRMRTELETTVLSLHGEITPYHTALIHSALRHEGVALLCQRWLRLEGNESSLADRLSLLATISRETDSRDKALKALGLDQSPKSANPWTAFDRLAAANGNGHTPTAIAPATEPPATPGTESTSETR